MHKTRLTIVILLFAVSCSRYPKDVERTLKFAGDNRAELEKVLEHYGKRPEDTLKYKAACFLIGNMPLHSSYHSAQIDTFKTAYSVARKKHADDIKIALNEQGKRHGNLSYISAQKVYDMHVITSDFLINNIDLAFHTWLEMPYGRHYSFSEFCDFVLPYRVMSEELEDWRELFYHTFKPIVDTVAFPEDPVYVARQINDYIISSGFIQVFHNNIPAMGPVTLMNNPFGTCTETTSLTAYALRSVGIPCGVDIMVQHPDRAGRHFWNFLIDTTNRPIPYDGFPYAGLKIIAVRDVVPYCKLGKVYREHYSLQKESLPFKATKGTYIPASLSYPNVKDVTSEYIGNNSIDIEPQMMGTTQTRKQFFFLSIFDIHGWVPIDWTVLNRGKATFKNVENDIVYMVLTHDGTQLVPVCFPFIVKDNNVSFIKPDHKHLTDMRIERKYPVNATNQSRMKGMIGGMFHAANRENFSDADLLWRITDYPSLRFQYVDLPPTDRTYRYFRYITPPGTTGNVGEIEAFDREGKRIEAKRVFGTKGNNWSALDYIYDGDPLTYYEAENDTEPVWIAVDFGEPRNIGSLRYISRNDDNSIRDGDQYELYYWNDMRWNALGSMTGDRNHAFDLKNIPSKALYWLRDHTRGKEERPFTYEDGKQVWW